MPQSHEKGLGTPPLEYLLANHYQAVRLNWQYTNNESQSKSLANQKCSQSILGSPSGGWKPMRWYRNKMATINFFANCVFGWGLTSSIGSYGMEPTLCFHVLILDWPPVNIVSPSMPVPPFVWIFAIYAGLLPMMRLLTQHFTLKIISHEHRWCYMHLCASNGAKKHPWCVLYYIFFLLSLVCHVSDYWFDWLDLWLCPSVRSSVVS